MGCCTCQAVRALLQKRIICRVSCRAVLLSQQHGPGEVAKNWWGKFRQGAGAYGGKAANVRATRVFWVGLFGWKLIDCTCQAVSGTALHVHHVQR